MKPTSLRTYNTRPPNWSVLLHFLQKISFLYSSMGVGEVSSMGSVNKFGGIVSMSNSSEPVPLHFLASQSSTPAVRELEAYFDFNGTDGTGIQLPASSISFPTTTTGYTLFTWLRVESFEDPNGIANFRPHIMTITSQGDGLLVFYFHQRQLNISLQVIYLIMRCLRHSQLTSTS